MALPGSAGAPPALSSGDGAPSGCQAAERGWSGAPIDTQHLRLRAFAAADAAEVTRQLDDWEVSRFSDNIPFPYDRDDAESFIAKVHQDRAEGRSLVFAVEARPDGYLTGCVGASLDGANAELGFWFARPQWGRGFATEAVRRCLRVLFQQFGIEQVSAQALPDNHASRRVLEKTGFVFVERHHAPLPARGRSDDLDVFTLDRASWQSRWAERPMLLVAAAALIDVDGRVLLACRPDGKSMAGQWEFPGGKLMSGETPEMALVRELAEELGIDVGQSCLAPLAFASHDYDAFHLLMPLYAARQWQGTPTPREGQRLAWVRPGRLADYPMPPADVPLVAILRDWL